MKNLLWGIGGVLVGWLVFGFFDKDYDLKGLLFFLVGYIVAYKVHKRKEEEEIE